MEQLTKKSFLIEFGLHVLVITILCILYVLMFFYPREVPGYVYHEFLETSPLLFFGIFYSLLFYRTFFMRILRSEGLRRILTAFALLLILFTVADLTMLNILVASRSSHYEFVGFNLTVIFNFLIFSTYALCYSLIKGYSWQKIRRLEAEKANSDATLHNLRSQIDPHFIFNSLNGVYALSLEEKAERTSQSIEELSGLFRYSLKDNNATSVSVSEELDFIDKYIQLQKIRIESNTMVEINTNSYWDKKPAMIAPMLIVMFVENAFKYGISLTRKSLVDIRIHIAEGKFALHIMNNYGDSQPGNSNGLGLKNAHDRLELLYPRNYSLEVKEAENLFEVILCINLN